MNETDDAVAMMVLLAVGFLGSCGSCLAEVVEKNEVCAVAAPNAATIRDSVALNAAGCDLKISTVAEVTE